MYKSSKYTPQQKSKTKILSYKQRKYHFSEKTGTISKGNKNKKNILTKKELQKINNINKKNEILINRTDLCSNDESYTHKRIIRKTTDDLIIELNQDNFKFQKKNIFEFAKVLSRFLPRDASQKCIHYCLNDMYIEKNIFQLIPDDIIDYLFKGTSYEKIFLKEKIIKKYENDKMFHVCNFMKDITMRRRRYFHINLEEVFIYDHIVNNILI